MSKEEKYDVCVGVASGDFEGKDPHCYQKRERKWT